MLQEWVRLSLDGVVVLRGLIARKRAPTCRSPLAGDMSGARPSLGKSTMPVSLTLKPVYSSLSQGRKGKIRIATPALNKEGLKGIGVEAMFRKVSYHRFAGLTQQVSRYSNKSDATLKVFGPSDPAYIPVSM